MIDPIVGDNWCRKQCRTIVKTCESFFVKHFVYPVVIVLPPAVMMAVAQKAELKKAAVDLAPSLGEMLSSGTALAVLIGAPIYMALVKAAYAGIKSYSKPARELSKAEVISILNAIEIAVNAKSIRMAAGAKGAIGKGSICPKETFKDITLPGQQMSLLTLGIHAVFERLSGDSIDFKVGLLKVNMNKPTDWLAFHPQAIVPSMSAEELAHKNSTVACCIRSKRIVIVDDIEKELKKKEEKRRYLTGSAEAKEKGSQLCFPVTHPATGKIQMVITIAGDKPNSLIEKHADLYEWVLKHFVVRLSLEQSLLIMKEKAND